MSGVIVHVAMVVLGNQSHCCPPSANGATVLRPNVDSSGGAVEGSLAPSTLSPMLLHFSRAAVGIL